MVIKIKDHIGRCYSNEDGKIIQNVLKKHLSNGDSLVVSFEGIEGVTSSFVNTAFIELLDDFSFDEIRSSLAFVDSTKQINTMIRTRFKFEVDRRKKLILV